MKRIILFAASAFSLTAVQAQSVGLRAAGSYRLLGPLLETRNGVSGSAGAYGDISFGKSRFGLSAGLNYAYINTDADEKTYPFGCGAYAHDGLFLGESVRYRALELPLQLSYRLAGSDRQGSSVHLLAGFAYSFLLSSHSTTEYLQGNSITHEEYRTGSLSSQVLLSGGAEYRFRLTSRGQLGCGVQYRHYAWGLNNDGPFNEAVVYLKAGLRCRKAEK